MYNMFIPIMNLIKDLFQKQCRLETALATSARLSLEPFRVPMAL
jgi:hypothetical protein